MSDYASQSTAQYLSSEQVMEAFYHHGLERLENATVFQVFLLACTAGGFIGMGALLSVLLAQATEPAGIKLLLRGLGFSAGFFFVILSSAVLFTEANVILPATLFQHKKAFS